MYTQDILVGDKHISLSTGKLAPQTNASVVAQFGNTVVLATVLMGKLDESKDYFPFYREKIPSYACTKLLLLLHYAPLY